MMLHVLDIEDTWHFPIISVSMQWKESHEQLYHRVWHDQWRIKKSIIHWVIQLSIMYYYYNHDRYVFCISGVINTFLSWKVFMILKRISYSAYLIHLIMMYAYVYNVKNPITFTHFNVVSSGVEYKRWTNRNMCLYNIKRLLLLQCSIHSLSEWRF